MATTTSTAVPSLDDLPEKPRVLPPSQLAHVVLNTTVDKFAIMRDFYKTFTGGHLVFESPVGAFLTYDHEHHRLAIVALPHFMPKQHNSAGLSHIAFTFPSIAALLTAYQQRKKLGITPAVCVNHGPTTSFYYKDPDGNMLETFVNNLDTVEEINEYMMMEEFQKNALGNEIVPEDLIARLNAGESEKDLKQKTDKVNMDPNVFLQRTA